MPATLPDFGQETESQVPEFGNELPDFGNANLPEFTDASEPAAETLEDSLASFNRLHPGTAAPRPSLEPELPPQPQPAPAVLEPPQLRPYQKVVPQTWEQMHEGVGGPVLDATQKRLLDAKRAYGVPDSSDEEFYQGHPQFKPLTATDMPMPRMSKGEVAAILPEWLAGPVAGAQQGIADFVDFATSPAGLATAVTGGVAGATTEAGAGAGAVVNRAMATGFAVDMAKDMPEQFDSILQSIRSGDSAAATRGMLAAGAALLMVGHAAKANVPHGTAEALKSAQEGSANVPPTEMGSPPTVQPQERAPNGKPEAKATPLSTADLEASVQAMIEEMTKGQIIKPKPEVPEGVQLPVFDKSEETARPQAQPLTPNQPTVGETTPVAPAPLRVTQDLRESTPILTAQELGVKFDGVHDYGVGEPSWSFTRESDGMSFNVPVDASAEQIEGAFAARKAQFEAEAPKPKQISAPETETPAELQRQLAEETVEPPADPALSVTKKRAMDAAHKNADFLIETANRYSSATFPQRLKGKVESAMGRMRQAARKIGVEVPSEGTWFSPQHNADLARKLKADLERLQKGEPVSVEPEPSQAKVETPAQAVAEVQGEISKRFESEGASSAKEAKSQIVQIEKAIAEAPNLADVERKTATDAKMRVYETQPDKRTKIQITIPGDGDFVVWNTKENLGQLLKRAKSIKTTTEKNYKESRPQANIPPDVFVESSEPTHEISTRKGREFETKKGKRVELDSAKAKGLKLWLTSNGEDYRVTEERTGNKVGDVADTQSAAKKNAIEHLNGISDPLDVVQKLVERDGGEAPAPKLIERAAPEQAKQPSIGAGIKKALERKGEAGAVSLPSAKELKEKLGELPEHAQAVFKWAGKQRERAVARSKRRGSYNLIAANKDSADNRGQIVAKQAANIVRHELNRAFGAPIEEQNPLREHALTFVIEASGDKASLGEMRYKIENAPEAPPLWKRRALKAIDFAEANWDKLSPVADGYKQLTDAENAYENFHGVQTLYRQGGYVFHLQDVDESFGIPSTGTPGGGGAPQPFRHIRDHPTYADSIAAGVTPESLSAVDLLQRRIALGQRLVNYGEWVESMRPMVDPATKLPIIENPIERTRADGTQDTTAPPGYKLVEFGGKQVALHNGYAGLFGDLTNISWMQGTEFRKNVMQSIGLAKHTALLFDTYHMGRLAFWNAVTRMGVPRYGRGVTLLDNTTAELKRMVERGEIPKEWGEKLVEDKRTLTRMVRAGMNVGNIGDNLYTDFLQKIPGIGDFNKWLFDAYQRGAMSEVALIERRRVDSTHPQLSEEAKDRMVAKEVNTRFGNLQSQSWIKSKTGQDLARIIFLAPQWNESLIRAELGAVARTTGAIAKGRPKQIGMLARGIGMAMLGTFIGNQLINFATRGKPTWENEEEGFGAKISAYIPDVSGGPGVFLNPMSLPAEITNLLFRNAERHGDFARLPKETAWKHAKRVESMIANSILDVAKGRFSSLSRGVWTWATGETPMGEQVGHGLESALSEAVPAPISGGAVYRLGKQLVTGEHQEKYPGQFERSILQSAGVKTEAVPGPEKRIRDLAVRFNRTRNVKEDVGFHEGAFNELTQAIRRQNMTDAQAALESLLEMDKSNGIKMSAADVTKHYQTWARSPFTHSRAREGSFQGTLTPEQRQTYEKARQDRQAVAAKAYQLLNSRAVTAATP